MEKTVFVTKGEMQTYFDPSGRARSVTELLGGEEKLAEIFKAGDKVTVIGISKGKGFAGVVRRHSFAGGPKTHGQSDRQRAPGAIGSTTTPGRVLKGKRMAGRMGQEQVTVKNLLVAEVNAEKNRVYVCGPVPGIRKGRVAIKIL